MFKVQSDKHSRSHRRTDPRLISRGDVWQHRSGVMRDKPLTRSAWLPLHQLALQSVNYHRPRRRRRRKAEFNITPDDCFQWNAFFRVHLQGLPLLHIVLGHEPRPDGKDSDDQDGTTAVELANMQEAWDRKDADAARQIFNLVSVGERMFIRYGHTAHEIWQDIIDRHQTKRLANELALGKQFYNTRLRKGEGLCEMANRVTWQAIALIGYGVLIPDSGVAMTMLSRTSRRVQLFDPGVR